jgi:hypothetical protein
LIQAPQNWTTALPLWRKQQVLLPLKERTWLPGFDGPR